MPSRNKAKTVLRKPRTPGEQGRGSWFELVVLIFMLGALYTIGALWNNSWTGAQGQLIGAYLRETWGGALLIPLLFLIYLCVMWFARSRVPRPLGQIVGTLQLYLTTAFILGLVHEAQLTLPLIGTEPGRIGSSLARFFILNLGAPGAITIAFASLALTSVLFGFKSPIRMFQAMTSRTDEKECEIEESNRINRTPPRVEVNVRPLPKANGDDLLLKKPLEPSLGSAPIDGLSVIGEELIPSPQPAPPSAAFTSAKMSAAVSEPKAPTATEILNELLASIKAEKSLTHVNEAKQEAPIEYMPPSHSASYSPPEQTIEIHSPTEFADAENLTSPPLSSNDVYAAARFKNIPSVDQETLPEIELTESDEKDDDNESPGFNGEIFPLPLDIFGALVKGEEYDNGRALAEQQAVIIVETLQNFGVKASVAHIVIGPSVIQFQLELAPGIKVSKVSGLANDLTMALAVISVRVEAPILGQRYVGIEIPNPKRKSITLRTIMESDEFQDGGYILPLPMGVQVDSRHLICGLEEMPHLLVAGTTGSGKSVFMNTCILGMCSQRSPEELRLILVDPKHVEFAIYDGLPHLLARPISDPKKAISALSWAVQEMEARSEAFAKTKVRNLASYNDKVLPKNRFPYIVVVVDELADLMYTAGKEVEGLIARLAQKARAAGIHLILATQRPSVDVITGLIKANVPARVAFAVPSQTDSRTIIDTGGADKLLGKGDMLFYSTRYPRPLRLQATFITEERTLAFVDYMKNALGEPDYIEFEDFAGANGPANGDRSGSSVVDDPKLDEAIKVVMDTGIASASGLQRYLNVGYPRAGRLITGLEQLGIVGPQTNNPSKPRDILMDTETAFDTLERARNGEA